MPGKPIGSIIKATREKLGWSHERLAEAANVKLRTLQDIEYGATKEPGFDRVMAILSILSKELGTSVAEFLGSEGPPAPRKTVVADLTPDELVDRLSRVISINAVPGELASAWREAPEQWQRDFALYILTGEDGYLRKVSPEVRRRLEKGLHAFGIQPEKSRSSKK